MSHTPWQPSQSAIRRVKNPLPIPTRCNCCLSSKIEIVPNREIYGGKDYGEWPWAVLCTKCRAYVGLHPGTNIPLGTLANAEMRKWRQLAKAAFNPIWERPYGLSRTDAYLWLAKQLGIQSDICHIGWFNVADCQRVVAVCEAYERR